jgi:8-oxo-dGTP diphosphatase
VPLGRADVTVSARRPIAVTAAVIERDDRFLLTRRLAGTHLEGRWEFPGGKCEPGEAHAAALARELLEELDVAIEVGPLILSTTHAYPEKSIALHFYAARLLGTPVPQLGQEMRWVPREDLHRLDLPDADAALIALLQERRG